MKEKLLKLCENLTNGQLDRLYDFFTVAIAWKNGTTTDLDFMRFIKTLPEEDVRIFTQVCNVIKS